MDCKHCVGSWGRNLVCKWFVALHDLIQSNNLTISFWDFFTKEIKILDHILSELLSVNALAHSWLNITAQKPIVGFIHTQIGTSQYGINKDQKIKD